MALNTSDQGFARARHARITVEEREAFETAWHGVQDQVARTMADRKLAPRQIKRLGNACQDQFLRLFARGKTANECAADTLLWAATEITAKYSR